jgi:hypothetical protein
MAATSSADLMAEQSIANETEMPAAQLSEARKEK